MNKQMQKQLWLNLHLSFIIAYTIYIITRIIRLPLLKSLPRQLFSILLIVAYGLTLDISAMVRNWSNVLTSRNFHCMLLFATFPQRFVFFPFYLSSILNVLDEVVRNKKIYKNSWFYDFSIKALAYQNQMCDGVYFSEICMIPVLFIALIIGKINIIGFIAFIQFIRLEYFINGEMRRAFGKLRNYLDNICRKLPGDLNRGYAYARDYIIKYHKID
ncbi:hypothetical protein TCON_0251 [Astathelohania contejeani]|uniref:Uncharacterized protein n=1 Tax=Astathelohania contejeani TaxID=164912 RepID=A0ABQ7I266_9MICR|nr:hypothetical protein TCON_0251 [Thelohania contejeani]